MRSTIRSYSAYVERHHFMPLGVKLQSHLLAGKFGNLSCSPLDDLPRKWDTGSIKLIRIHEYQFTAGDHKNLAGSLNSNFCCVSMRRRNPEITLRGNLK